MNDESGKDTKSCEDAFVTENTEGDIATGMGTPIQIASSDSEKDNEPKEKLARALYKSIQQSHKMPKVHFSVIIKRDKIFNRTLPSAVFYGAKKSLFKFLVEDKNNFYLVHDCLLDNETCQCLTEEFNGRQQDVRIMESQEFSFKDCENLVQDHFKDGRIALQVHVGEKDYTQSMNDNK